MSRTSVLIVSAKRTPIGAFQGVLAPASAPQLGAAAAKAALAAAGVGGSDVDEVILGCVLPAGVGQGPARQAAIASGIPVHVPATTVNKLCGSGLKAIMQGADQIRLGDVNTVLAGGLESMTNAPHLLPKARAGLRMGHAELLDHMQSEPVHSRRRSRRSPSRRARARSSSSETRRHSPWISIAFRP